MSAQKPQNGGFPGPGEQLGRHISRVIQPHVGGYYSPQISAVHVFPG